MINFAPTVIFALLVNTFPEIECSTRCYKCLAAPPTYYTKETYHLCEDFDYSDKFIIDCPYSTFCMKTITSAKILGVINGTQRECANQKQIIQKYNINIRKWEDQVHMEDPYESGCTLENDKGARTATIEHCYCKGDLCNSSENTKSRIYFVFLAVIALVILPYTSFL
ncbi:hypothetical protein JTB14_016037 [Gonioctena quinquepunctata]|nr:hypothetical protein JTB14_016037 [Gonioctena quinquepunctata]